MNATGTGLRRGTHRVSTFAATLFLLLVLAAAAGYLVHSVTTQPAATHATGRPAAAAIAHAVDPVGDGHRQNLPAPREQVNPAGDGHVAY